jgi:membrane protease YdiL (CAAX protease family)
VSFDFEKAKTRKAAGARSYDALLMNMRTSVTLELAGVAALALLFVASFRVRPAYIDFALAAAAVASIAAGAARSRAIWRLAAPEARADRGRAWLATALFTAAALLVLAAATVLSTRGTDVSLPQRFMNSHLLLAAALYFPWALLQQFIFQFYLFGRLLHLVPAPFAVALTAAAFACVHFPRWPVMTVTLVAGAVWSMTYYRWRSLWPLALSHALLGATLHYWLFGNDLLARWLPAEGP